MRLSYLNNNMELLGILKWLFLKLQRLLQKTLSRTFLLALEKIGKIHLNFYTRPRSLVPVGSLLQRGMTQRTELQRTLFFLFLSISASFQLLKRILNNRIDKKGKEMCISGQLCSIEK